MTYAIGHWPILICHLKPHDGLVSLPAEEQPEIDRLAHLEIADGRRMDAITAVIGWVDEVAVTWAANDLIEVDYTVKSRFRANPLVDLVTDPGLQFVPVRAVLDGGDIVPRDDRDTNNSDALGLDAIHDVLQ